MRVLGSVEWPLSGSAVAWSSTVPGGRTPISGFWRAVPPYHRCTVVPSCTAVTSLATSGKRSRAPRTVAEMQMLNIQHFLQLDRPSDERTDSADRGTRPSRSPCGCTLASSLPTASSLACQCGQTIPYDGCTLDGDMFNKGVSTTYSVGYETSRSHEYARSHARCHQDAQDQLPSTPQRSRVAQHLLYATARYTSMVHIRGSNEVESSRLQRQKRFRDSVLWFRGAIPLPF